MYTEYKQCDSDLGGQSIDLDGYNMEKRSNIKL